jgi:hypothetical protein
MKILVCVKQVPDTAAERTLRPGERTLDREAVDGLINEFDEYAIEEDLKIAEARGVSLVFAPCAVDVRRQRAGAGPPLRPLSAPDLRPQGLWLGLFIDGGTSAPGQLGCTGVCHG